MVNIYRVENKKREGCYWGKQRDYKMLNIIGGHFKTTSKTIEFEIEKHPLPHEDKKIKRCIKDNEIGGFLNKEQALNWFTKDELNGLEKIGYFLKRIKVKKITVIGEKQVLAIR